MAATVPNYTSNHAPPVYDRYKLAQEKPKFRGCWSPSIADPSVRSFVPVASSAPAPRPAAAPRAAPAAPKPAPVLTPVEPPKTGVRLKILDRCRDLRSFITDDGTCTDRYGRVIGYINFNDWTVGGPDETFWGSLLEEQILDKDDKQIGEIDFGRAWVKDQNGNTVCEMDNAGECKGHDWSFIGHFEGFTYHDMKTVALYLIIIDPLMYNTVSG